MARPQNRKRPRANESSQSKPPSKKAKLTRESNFSPEFWDNLSKIWLTPRALRELDRRNKTQPSPRFPVPKLYPTQLARFARHGGPDLRHLRGYTEHDSIAEDMSSSLSSTSRSRQTRSTNATSVGTRTKKSSAYGKEFQQHLTDYNIYRADHDYDDDVLEPENLARIHQELTVERASLSPSQFTPSAFRDFKQRNAQATFEKDVVRTIIPIISGDSSIHNQQDVRFTELEPMTNQDAVKPQPDFFDGARLRDLSQTVRNDQVILSTGIPTKHPDVPIEPNFFLEVKGPDGNAAVAQRQACYDGAYGACAMHALQNHRETEPIYDGNAYTYSSTYHSSTGTLQLYAHHVTAPATAEGRSEYHMTQAGAYALTHSRASFIQGATAFRNARDSAERHRNSFIQAANARAVQETSAMQVLVKAGEEASGPLSLHPSEDKTVHTAWQDADYALQQQIANTSQHALQHEAGVESAIPRYSYAEEDTPNPSQQSAALALNDPSMSSASSFTTLTTDPVQPKRSRDSCSPPSTSKRTNPSQRRTASGTAPRTARSSGQATVSAHPGSATSHWVRTFRHRGKVCFKDLNGEEIKTESKEWTEQTVDETQCYYWQSDASQPSFWATELPKEERKGRRHRS
ncbi:hypothetical protein MAJ_10453, partial [Metarhizium majus ARSEF 297]